LPLASRNATVVFQDLLDAVRKRTDLRFGEGNLTPIAGRFTVLQNLLQRLPVHPRLAENLTLADFLHQNTTTNLCPCVLCLSTPSDLRVGSLRERNLSSSELDPLLGQCKRVPHNSSDPVRRFERWRKRSVFNLIAFAKLMKCI